MMTDPRLSLARVCSSPALVWQLSPTWSLPAGWCAARAHGEDARSTEVSGCPPPQCARSLALPPSLTPSPFLLFPLTFPLYFLPPFFLSISFLSLPLFLSSLPLFLSSLSLSFIYLFPFSTSLAIFLSSLPLSFLSFFLSYFFSSLTFLSFLFLSLSFFSLSLCLTTEVVN